VRFGMRTIVRVSLGPASAACLAVYPFLSPPPINRGAHHAGGFRAKCWLGILAGVGILVFAPLDAAVGAPKRVLLLYSLGRDFSPFKDFSETFREQLIRQSPDPVDIYEASLETARYDRGDSEAPFVDYLHALFGQRRLDMVLAIGAPAASFSQRHRQQLFPATPLVFAGIDERILKGATLTPSDTIVATSNNLPAAIDNILRVLPETNRIAVVIGNSPLEQFWLTEMQRQFQPYAGRINFIWMNKLSFSAMQKQVAALPPKSAIIFELLLVDGEGVPYEQERALVDIRAVANAPIFGLFDSYLGRGIVGGPLIAFQENGRQAASVAVRIFRGEAPSSIKAPVTKLTPPLFDWRELQRWKISEASLPPGSEIRFRPPSLWEQYHWSLTLILVVVLVQAALILGLLFERRRRRLAELEARSRVLEVAHLNRVATIGAMSASIAHELNQPLGAILANAETAELLLVRNPVNRDQLKELLDDIRKSDRRAADIIAHLRGLLQKGGETELRSFDLNDAIRDALHTLEPESRKRGVQVDPYQVRGALPVRADQVHLEQVILNLAINAMDAMQSCPSGSRNLTLQAAPIGESEVEVSVSDSGTGIPVHELKAVFDTFFTTKQEGTGLGLSIVRTILENYGGKIRAENRPAGGAVFRFTLPLAKARAG
jgi:signal transduction histidine kinase